MLDVVTFRWGDKFHACHVNALHDAVCRHYRGAMRFSVVTDDAAGIDAAIRVIPLWADHAAVGSPHGPRHPSCYRRLKLFAPEARDLIGERIVCLDLDVVVIGDLTPLWERREEIVFYAGQWGSPGRPNRRRQPYNGSMFMLTAGARPRVWSDFDPRRTPQLTRAAGFGGSDQAWYALALGRGEAVWGTADGVYSYRNDIEPNSGRLPQDARMVMFHGRRNPWDDDMQRLAWVRQHYGTRPKR